MPRIYIIGGCNGAGKTTAAYTALPNMFDFNEYVNADEIARKLNPENPDKAAMHASRIMLDHLDELIARGETFCLETTLSTKSLYSILLKAKEKGYKVTIVYFMLKSPELAVERVAKRVLSGGHNIPKDTIYRRYERGIMNFFQLYMSVADRWMLLDNSDTPSTMIAQGGTNFRTEIVNKTIYNKVLDYVQAHK